MRAVNRSLVRIVLFVSLLSIALGQTSSNPQLQHLNIQVSDASNNPMAGVQITTKCPGNLAKTDNAGKATINFQPTGGAIELVIVAPKGLDFISPWGRSVTLPPEFWPITVAPHGQREMLEHPKVVSSLTATIDKLQVRTDSTAPAPSSETRERAVSKVADALGLSASDLRKSIQEWGAKATATYSVGLFSLYNLSYQKAAQSFSETLVSLKGSTSPADLQDAADAAFLLGSSSFEMGDYKKSVDAYRQALAIRPGDPLALKSADFSSLALAGSQSPDPIKPNLNSYPQKEIANDENDRSSPQRDTQNAVNHIQTVETVVANLDQYKRSTQTEIRFHRHQMTLSKNAKDALDQVATDARDQHSYIIEVQGFANDKGDKSLQDSQKMAESVVRYLVLNHEIPVYRIYVIGMGNTAAADEGDTKAGRAQAGGHVDVTVLKSGLQEQSIKPD